MTNITSKAWSAIAPSNIAFVKYWGKRDAKRQWPANDSISMTLDASHTVTTARLDDGPCDRFQMANQTPITSISHPDHKIFRHLDFLRQQLGTRGRLMIQSHNTFPSSCGIASSASGFAALTVAATAAWLGSSDWNELALHGASRNALAHWARQGSGSAGRSLFGGFVQWDAGPSATEQIIRPIAAADHWSLSDVIAVISTDEKAVSSTDAHSAAWGSPLFTPRLAGINDRLKRVSHAIQTRNLELLGLEIESDALEMHAVAMTGVPAVNYFTTETVQFLAWVRGERARGVFPAYFTVDAGPNVHLICESRDAHQIKQRIQNEWPTIKTLVDAVGNGPQIFAGTSEL